ncbi:hypothetical protein GGX14DRAFT_353663 [Mycena pura]|uniref:BTB domain-containing protein n=1 Tax=Mycena pura TaxID=153505 RepID=A0AAD6VTN1_9AGAR|nr:hypothetical protein GGX14DRAFT_353663 [Mycena pura]
MTSQVQATHSKRCKLHTYSRLAQTQLTARPVNFPDSDIAFRSCDHRIFRVHVRNLETHAEGFPPAAFCAQEDGSEVVDLSEPAATLELLFQYMYPQRQPDLTALEFSLLADLAEAAEKYQVYAAMDICRIFMGNGLQDNALTVLNYAVRHDYRDIADEAAPLTISLPLEEVATHMHPTYMGSWVRIIYNYRYLF